MKELIIEHITGEIDRSARIRLGYRSSKQLKFEWLEGSFIFEILEFERELIRWYLEDYLFCPWEAFELRANQAMATMQSVGERLFRAVFKSTSAITEFYNQLKEDLENTYVRVFASGPVGQSLPWELLQDPDRDNPYITRAAYSFVRGQPGLLYNNSTSDVSNTLNILLVISRPGGENDVPFQSVARRLLEAVQPHAGHISIDILRPPTFEKLTEVLQSRPGYYQVLHFDGHGVFSDRSSQGMLFSEGEKGYSRPVSGTEFGTLLKVSNVPIVVLNACQSGRTTPDSVFTSIANQLLRVKVSAVVAMAYSIYVKSAADFIACFYENLLQGEEVARSVQLGREKLATDILRSSPKGAVSLSDWIVPVIFEDSSVQLFSPKIQNSSTTSLNPSYPTDQRLVGFEHSRPPSRIIGRDNFTQNLERAFFNGHVVLVKGMVGVGKTSFVSNFAKWWVETGGLDSSTSPQGKAFFFSLEHHQTVSEIIDDIYHALARITEIKIEGNRGEIAGTDRTIDNVIILLSKMSCLIVLDDFDHVFSRSATWTAYEQLKLINFIRRLRHTNSKLIIVSNASNQ